MTANSKICGVYCWTHPPTGRKYVGSSVDCEKRRNRHLSVARKPNPTCFALQIAKHGAEQFTFEILEHCAPGERFAREAHYISTLNTLVPNGFNIQKDPTKGPTCVWSQDMRAARSALNKQRSPEVLAAMSAGAKAYWSSPEARAAQSKRTKAFQATPEGRAIVAAQMKASLHTPGVRAALSLKGKAQFAAPGARAAQSARLKAFSITPKGREQAAARSAMLKARMTTPEARAANSARNKVYWSLPENRAAASQRTKAFHAQHG